MRYHLVQNKPVNLPFLMLHHMINAIRDNKASTSLPYGIPLTRIFNHFKINISCEEGTIERKIFTAKNIKLMGIGQTITEEDKKRKKKKEQKTKKFSEVSEETSTEETLVEVLRREMRTKKRNDSQVQEEIDELEEGHEMKIDLEKGQSRNGRI